MSTAPIVDQPAGEPSQNARRRRNGRGRGRGRGNGDAGRPAANTAPATSESIPQPAPDPVLRGGGRGGRGGGRDARGGRGRGHGRGRGERFLQRMAPSGRQFGGQLTVEETAASSSAQQPAPGLQADAPAFQPGQPITPRNPRQRRPRKPMSEAQDIATRTHEDIDNGHYECAICTDEIRRSAKGVWSCRTCWTVFHLRCVRMWANKGQSAREQANHGEAPSNTWRCPGCNLPQEDLPTVFNCWCEKESNPKPLPGLPPFSCGQTCARPRIFPKKCPHPCDSICHAGPCQPCNFMGIPEKCFCGKNTATRRCLDTKYEQAGWSCEAVCGRAMACGEHRCPQPCHAGSCGPCKVELPARCYCGKVQTDILCCNREQEKRSSHSHLAADGTISDEQWTGSFQCPSPCSRSFDCGKHRCEKPCHQQDANISHCPRSPDIVTHCLCGKTHLSRIPNALRTTCEDPVPNCEELCGRLLDCGHQCQQSCHSGECRPCSQKVTVSCRCGRVESPTICHQGVTEHPQCRRVCRATLNCGRHDCGDRCCTGDSEESRRRARQESRRQARTPVSEPTPILFQPEHICTRSCDRPLKCGNPEHRCEALCHKGPCASCRDAIFVELSCHCGRTVLQPPLPCGTKPPPCRFQCDRPRDCGHPQSAHECHGDEHECPKCVYLTTKPCLCGKNVLKNQQCWLSEVRCGEVCGRTLRCGVHKCQKQCHRSGECDEPCKQPCGKELSVCGHPCDAVCHIPSLCKEERPCQHKIFVTCECQRIKQEAKCHASRRGEGNLKKTLKCDEECARLERNRKLALALNVDPEHQSDHIPYSDATLSMYQQNSTWAATQEKLLRLFAADPEERRLRFKPMPRNQRGFVHSLAEDFGFDSESMDAEPHRHVAIFKTPRFVMAPMRTLAECARTRQIQQRSTVRTAVSASTLRPKPSNTTGDPYNAFVILNPRFALTVEEVNVAVKSVLATTAFRLELETNFLPAEVVSLKPPLAARLSIPDREMETMLESIKAPLLRALKEQNIGSLQLARLDSSLNILRKESDIGPGSGWSQVAASKSAPLRQVQKNSVFNQGGFAVLSLSSSKKKKERAVEVVEDWEAAEEEEEEKEKANSKAASEDEEAGPADKGDNAHVEENVLPTRPTLGRWADLEDK